jgi:hypothetical protein
MKVVAINLYFLIISSVRKRFRLKKCISWQNFHRTVFYKIFAVYRFCLGGMRIFWFKMLFSYRNIDFWNSAIWNKMIPIPEITPFSTQIKNPRRSRITCNSLVCSDIFSDNFGKLLKWGLQVKFFTAWVFRLSDFLKTIFRL